MGTLTVTGFPHLHGLHSSTWGSKRVAFYKVGGSASRPSRCGFRIAAQTVFPAHQCCLGRSGKVCGYLSYAYRREENPSRRVSLLVRKALNRSRNFPSLHREFPESRRGSACRNASLRIRCNIKGRKFRLLAARAEDGSSAKSGDFTLEKDEAAQLSTSSTTPASSSSHRQVDWNKLIFNWRRDEPMWKVPWTGQTIFQVMVLWFAAFWVMGSWVLPIAAQIAGFSRHSLTFRGQALYSLLTDIAEGTVGIWILRRCLAQFYPLPDGWFPMKWRGKWLAEAFWGCLLFPFVNKLSQLNLYLIPLPALTASYVEQSMMSRDPVATLLYAIVISVCAPIWEEVIFRGFLLPSMTRYMPLWGAILVSAVAFAMAHFSMQRILPLTFLGLVMGFVFVRSKNLLASIVLHSLWNGFAFLELL